MIQPLISEFLTVSLCAKTVAQYILPGIEYHSSVRFWTRRAGLVSVFYGKEKYFLMSLVPVASSWTLLSLRKKISLIVIL